MNRESLYEAGDDDYDEDIGEDLEDLRRACIFFKAKGMPSDSENEEDDLEMLRSIKCQLASSTDMDLSGTPPMDSESEDDLEMVRSIKSLLSMSMDEDEVDDDPFETLHATRRRFSAYDNLDLEGNLRNDSPGKKKQVHASDNEHSTEILSRSNTCESFPDHGNSVAPVADSETSIEPLEHMETCQSSLTPAMSSCFPESAQAFVDAIRKNRAYQSLLRRKLSEIESTIEQNDKHKKNVKIVKDFQASCKRITKQALSQRRDPRVELISTPKSGPASDSSEGNDKKTSPLMLGPRENPCVANYRMALEKYPVSMERGNWTSKEKEDLTKGLKQQLQDTLIREAFERSSDLEGSTVDISTILEAIKNLEITPEMIRQFLPKVNWDQLDIKNRSAAECEARWMSSEDPLINNGPWTVAEDNHIRLITQNKSFKDWLDITVSLGTNRTPFQCLVRYQRSLNPYILKKEWTAEEDEQLRAAVDLIGEKDWQSVANLLKGRTGPQCSNRWKKSLHFNIKREGRRMWRSEDDRRLKVAVTLFGTQSWHKIAQFVPGRTGSQCRERWENSLNPKLKFGNWTKEEDAKLREAMKEHGHCWSKVASYMSCRTDSQCSRRWKSLYPHLVAHLKQEARKLQKETTIGNFVGRESERPDLVISDFWSLAEISHEQEPVLKKKRKEIQKKAGAECESEAFDTERQPKRRRKGLEGCSGDDCRQENEKTEDNIKEKKQRRKRLSVAETSSSNSSVTTKCHRVKVGIQKLKPRRKVSAVVPIENQDAPN